jgi:hypothetical protein
VCNIARAELIDVSIDMFEPIVQANLNDDRRFYPNAPNLSGAAAHLGTRHGGEPARIGPAMSLTKS